MTGVGLVVSRRLEVGSLLVITIAELGNATNKFNKTFLVRVARHADPRRLPHRRHVQRAAHVSGVHVAGDVRRNARGLDRVSRSRSAVTSAPPGSGGNPPPAVALSPSEQSAKRRATGADVTR